ncbi:hypothetical protein OA39_02920 [Vibrio campbellii]|uniref:EpsG family protein n=1 Tax=Vibrio campbellii TaxID=680 RepID=UPI000531DA5D|nr:hypothetical protein OA39_02920 [Vibrio campbellii]
MGVYLTYYVFLIVSLIFSLKNRILDLYFYFFVSCVSVFFIGARFEVGADYTEYSSLFYSSATTRFEPFFNVTFELFRELGFTYNSLSLCYFLITILLLTYAIKDFEYKTLFLVSFILFLFVPITSTIRQGLSLPFYILAIVNYNSFKKYSIFTILGAFFHASTLVLIPLYLLSKFKISKFNFILLVFISIFIGFLNPINILISLMQMISSDFLIANKLLTYSTRYSDPMSLSAQLYRVGFVVVLLYIWNVIENDRVATFSKNIYIFIFLLTFVFKDNGVLVNRLAFSTNITILCILSRYLILENISLKKTFVSLFLIVYFSVNYYKFIYTDMRHSVEKAYLPYKNGLIINEFKK